jgi:hypothetical protein
MTLVAYLAPASAAGWPGNLQEFIQLSAPSLTKLFEAFLVAFQPVILFTSRYAGAGAIDSILRDIYHRQIFHYPADQHTH